MPRERRRSPWRALPAIVTVVLPALSGCYRIATPGPPRPTVPGPSKEVMTYVWGLLQDDDLGDICQGRGEGGIAEVRVTTTPLMALETAMTLGFWAPIHVETECLKLGPDGRLEHGAEHGHP